MAWLARESISKVLRWSVSKSTRPKRSSAAVRSVAYAPAAYEP
jgi:hypothetical protein